MSQYDMLRVPFSCLSFLVWLMRWNHTTSHGSQILCWRSSGWLNVIRCDFVQLLIWGWRLLMVENCFAMGLRGAIMTSVLASGNSWNDSLWIASVILSQQKKGLRRRTYLPLVTLITKSLCLPIGASTISVLLLVIQISARYRRSRSLLLLLLLLAVQLLRRLKIREGGILWRLGVNEIGCYLMEGYVWREVSSTAVAVKFGLGGGSTTVNRMDMTALHQTMNPLLLIVDIFPSSLL